MPRRMLLALVALVAALSAAGVMVAGLLAPAGPGRAPGGPVESGRGALSVSYNVSVVPPEALRAAEGLVNESLLESISRGELVLVNITLNISNRGSEPATVHYGPVCLAFGLKNMSYQLPRVEVERRSGMVYGAPSLCYGMFVSERIDPGGSLELRSYVLATSDFQGNISFTLEYIYGMSARVEVLNVTVPLSLGGGQEG